MLLATVSKICAETMRTTPPEKKKNRSSPRRVVVADDDGSSSPFLDHTKVVVSAAAASAQQHGVDILASAALSHSEDAHAPGGVGKVAKMKGTAGSRSSLGSSKSPSKKKKPPTSSSSHRKKVRKSNGGSSKNNKKDDHHQQASTIETATTNHSEEGEDSSEQGTCSFTSKDVLSGRGGATNLHPGNRYYRDLILKHRQVYDLASKGRKPDVARKIVQMIIDRGGRFLQKGSDGLYRPTTDAAAREKTSQALRHRTFEMRNKAGKEAAGAADDSSPATTGATRAQASSSQYSEDGISRSSSTSELGDREPPKQRAQPRKRKSGSTDLKNERKAKSPKSAADDYERDEESMHLSLNHPELQPRDVASSLGATTPSAAQLLAAEQQRAGAAQSILIGMQQRLGLTTSDESPQDQATTQAHQQQLLELQQQQRQQRQQHLLQQLHQQQLLLQLDGGMMSSVPWMDAAATRLLIEQDQNRRLELLAAAAPAPVNSSSSEANSSSRVGHDVAAPGVAQTEQQQQHFQPYFDAILRLREREMVFAAEAEILRRQRLAMEVAGEGAGIGKHQGNPAASVTNAIPSSEKNLQWDSEDQ